MSTDVERYRQVVLTEERARREMNARATEIQTGQRKAAEEKEAAEAEARRKRLEKLASDQGDVYAKYLLK